MEKSALNKRQLISSERGFVMVEAIVGVILASIFLTAFISLNTQAIKLDRTNANSFKANMYLRELIEITKDLEQSDWDMISDCSLETEYYPKIDTIDGKNKWKLSSSADDAELLDNTYSRSIIIDDVYRNKPNNEFPNKIVSKETDEAKLDSNTKKITAKITWNDGSFHEMKLETYVYNFND